MRSSSAPLDGLPFYLSTGPATCTLVELLPYRDRGAIMSSQRISRGFHRLGMVLATIPATGTASELLAWLQRKLGGLVTAVRGGATRSVQHAVNVRHAFPLVTRAEQAIRTRWPETISRARLIVSNFVSIGYPKVRQAYLLAIQAETQKAADKLSEVLLEAATADSSWLTAALNEIVGVIDQIALRDPASAEQVRALLRQALVNAYPVSPSSSATLKLAYIYRTLPCRAQPPIACI
jgi:hypothetical protein